jgi:probable F420-dependent oxidoreductase
MTRYAIAIPQVYPDGTFEPEPLRAYLQRAEELGFHSAWTQEHTLNSTPVLDPLELMTYAAALCGRLRLGCAVFVSTLRNPVHLAKSLSTIDQLSRGRLETGFAVGQETHLAAFGVEQADLVARFTEGLQVMKACWTEPTISFAGRFWKLEGVPMEPKPWQKPHPPLWIGGGRPRAVRRAVAYGTGFFGAGVSTTASFAEQVQVVRAALAESGRDAGEFGIAKRVYITIDDDAGRARDRMSDGLLRLYGAYGMTDLLPVAVYGTPEDCVRGLREVAAAGAKLILLNPLDRELEQMEWLAEAVLPRVSGEL